MELREGGCSVTRPYRDFARLRSLGDAEQQIDQQIAPQQSGELLGKVGRATIEQQ